MKFFRNNILSILFSALIAVSSFTSSKSISKINFLHLQNIDKVVHLLMYACLTFLILFENRNRIKNKIHYVLIISITFAYGLIIEILQPIITNSRSRELADMMFNLSGIIAVVIIWYVINNYKKKL